MPGVTGALLGVKYAVYAKIGDFVYKALFACVVGGLGSLSGAVMGGILIGLMETFVSAYMKLGGKPLQSPSRSWSRCCCSGHRA
ncbi:MAG: hypothetical protein MZU95_11860 [Desulfomicrobium escambiense]|nr:hypothetical protein [Desulfomicrobium escambiense]